MYLLDTHSFLWFIAGDEKLSRLARSLMTEGGVRLFLSSASLWEIAIKVSVGKLVLSAPFAELIPELLAVNEIDILPIKVSDLAVLVQLPFHHRDPFDRLLAAQSSANSLPLISGDTNFDEYQVIRLW